MRRTTPLSSHAPAAPGHVAAVALGLAVAACSPVTADPDANAPADAHRSDAAPDGAADGQADAAPTPVPTDALVYLPFDGTTEDASGNDNHGSTQWAEYTADRFGLADAAYDIAAANDGFNWASISVPHLGFERDFTIAAWVDMSFTGEGMRIAGQADWFELRFGPGGKARFGWPDPDGNGSPMATAPSEHPTDVWVFYVGVVEFDGDDSNIRLYQDGLLADEQQVANEIYTSPNACHFVVGNHPNSQDDCTNNDEAQQWNGAVDDVRVFDRALSTAEVEALYRERTDD